MKTKLVLGIMVIVAIVSFGAARSTHGKTAAQNTNHSATPTIGGLVIDDK